MAHTVTKLGFIIVLSRQFHMEITDLKVNYIKHHTEYIIVIWIAVSPGDI